MKPDQNKIIENVTKSKYKYGFISNIEMETAVKGITEDTIRYISNKKNEPEFMFEFRMKAFKKWLKMKQPNWAHLKIPHIDYQNIIYYAAPKSKTKLKSNDNVDPELLKTFNKLGISLKEQKKLSGTAVDAVFDSVSVKTTFSDTLLKLGIIFCPIGEAVQKYPDLIKKYLGSVIPYNDNFFAALNSAVFSDGTFCYIPKGVKCPIDISTYFRMNTAYIGQFERTLIIAEEDSYVSYMEGCTAPIRPETQLHSGVVEIVIKKNAEVKYSTVQNWYPGGKDGKGGVFNMGSKRGLCLGENSKLSWNMVETGSAINWTYPSTILKGDNSSSEYNAITLTNNYQQTDAGTKMIHLGKNTKSTVISKGISAGHSQNSFRSLIKIFTKAVNSRNYTQCDSLLLGNKCGAHTFPHIEVANKSSVAEHEATTSKINEDQLFYCNQRGINTENAVNLIVNGYAKDVMKKLPMEFAVEAQTLLSVSLQGGIG